MNFITNCVFLDESAFHINLRRSMAWSKKGTPAVVTVPATRAKTTTRLDATSASGLINVSLRAPKPVKKRKIGQESECLSIGTVTGHYISFLKDTLGEMDKYPEMKSHYVVHGLRFTVLLNNVSLNSCCGRKLRREGDELLDFSVSFAL